MMMYTQEKRESEKPIRVNQRIMEYSKSKPSDYIKKRIKEMSPYVPGKQPVNPETIKLNTNENPFPPSRRVQEALIKLIQSDTLHKYPDPTASKLGKSLPNALAAGPIELSLPTGPMKPSH